MEVYIVKVSMPSPRFVNKSVFKCTVVKHGAKHLTLSNRGIDTFKHPVEQCYTDLDRAMLECESQSNELISRLNMLIGELKQPVEVRDLTQSVVGDELGE